MRSDEVTVRSVRVLRGPNLYAYMPVLHIVLDTGPYEERPSNTFEGFVDRLAGWLPGIRTHQCSLGRPGGFVERLERGTYLAHIAEHVTLELQGLMGFDVSFGRARGTGERGVYDVIIAYKEEEPAKAAFETALRLVLAAMHDEPFDVAAELEALLEVAEEYRLGPSTAAIVSAARRRGIPVVRLTPTQGLVQLGYGKYQKRIRASETSNTSAIAVDMCQEKPLTNMMLRTVGVPVPDGRAVRSEDEAWQAAQEIGLPVVVKPEDGNQGKGVSVNLLDEAEVRAAYRISREFRGDVLVERYIEGDDYRLLVVNGTMVAAARRDPASVMGDGRQTIAELVAEVNRDPRRRPGHGSALTRIRLDEAAELVLQQQGLIPLSVPDLGRIVRLRSNGNLSTGGTATDVTDEVHPQNAHLAEMAAQILALDVAGIDVICRDIRRPLRELRATGLPCRVIDASERLVTPGLIDPHEHLIGAGGEEGFGARTPEIPFNEIVTAGITTVVGCLGTDTVTRWLTTLLGRARQLQEEGVTAYMYTGGYPIPPPTITGTVTNDLVLIDRVIGVGEVAIADTRAWKPTAHQFASYVTEAMVGGSLSGKAGVVHAHVGAGESRLSLLHRIVDELEVNPAHIHAAHVNRNEALMDDAIALARKGAFVCVDTTDDQTGRWLRYYRDGGGPWERLTVASDAYTPGATPGQLRAALTASVLAEGLLLETVLPTFTSNTACALKLESKGCLREGADADVVLLDADTLTVTDVLARGRQVVAQGDVVLPDDPDQ